MKTRFCPFDTVSPHPVASTARSIHPSIGMPNAMRSSLKTTPPRLFGTSNPYTTKSISQLAKQPSAFGHGLCALPFAGGSQPAATSDDEPSSRSSQIRSSEEQLGMTAGDLSDASRGSGCIERGVGDAACALCLITPSSGGGTTSWLLRAMPCRSRLGATAPSALAGLLWSTCCTTVNIGHACRGHPRKRLRDA